MEGEAGESGGQGGDGERGGEEERDGEKEGRERTGKIWKEGTFQTAVKMGLSIWSLTKKNYRSFSLSFTLRKLSVTIFLKVITFSVFFCFIKLNFPYLYAPIPIHYYLNLCCD